MKKELLQFTSKGIYCPVGKFYIDPHKPVDRALITHAHSDHASWGHGSYLGTKLSEPILRHRLGKEINLQTAEYGETITENGVKISFHPSGHVIGSAQIRLEYEGEVWVATGDYKTEDDGITTPFEPVKCDVFITESTFGLPIYKWKKQDEIFAEVNEWWKENQREGKVSILFGYALGKAQRLLCNVDRSIGKIFAHGTIYNTNEVFREAGIDIPYIEKVTKDHKKEDFKGALILATKSVMGTPWLKKFYPYSLANASGWMTVRGIKRRNAIDRGFAISDHADWTGLNEAVKATEANKVYVVHGFTHTFSRWLKENGIDAEPAVAGFVSDEEIE